MAETKLLYIIKWVKGEKPYFQFGEFINTGEGRVIPSPPANYTNLNMLFQYLQNVYSTKVNTLLTMNMGEDEKQILDRFISTHPYIAKHKHLSKPAGKKTDGSPFRVYLVDDNMQDMKAVRQILMDEHFEIVGFAKTPENADKFISSNIRHIDLIICEIYLTDGNLFEVLRKVKLLRQDVMTLVISKSSNKVDVQKVLSLKTDGYMIKPVDRENLLKQLRRICNT